MNIILISVDTLSAKHLGCYGYLCPSGYNRNTSPFMDKFSQEGAQFTQMIAPNIPTTPAYTSIFTGLSAFTHRIVTHGPENIMLDKKLPLLAEVLWDNDYLTAGVTNLYSIKHWFARGFKHYMHPERMQHISGDKINELAVPWLENYHNKGKFFLFIHYWDPHTPYFPPENMRKLHYHGNEKDPDNHSLDKHKKQQTYPFYHKWWLGELEKQGITDAEYITAQYDAEITYVDKMIAELLETIDRLGLRKNTVVIITSDHGESMAGEHDFYWDHQGTYEQVIHVPLLIRGPDYFCGGKKIDSLVQHIDLAPTIAEIAGINRCKNWEGESLIPLIKGEKKQIHEFVILSECVWQSRYGIRTEEWKLVKTIDKGLFNRPEKELFNLYRDPEELTNLIEKEPDTTQDLENKLEKWITDKLNNQINPLKVEVSSGLPGKLWLDRTLKSMNLTLEEFQKKQKYI